MRSLGWIAALSVAALLGAAGCHGDAPQAPATAESTGPTVTVPREAAPAPPPAKSAKAMADQDNYGDEEAEE